MRIVGGEHSGRKLSVPKGRDIRPTSDKIRGAIFNALSARGAIEDAYVLDCFCGTGALGLEALSRGAVQVMFWDQDAVSLALAKENAQSLNVMGQCAFQKRDATKSSAPKTGEGYSLVFLDPPYRKNLIHKTLQSLSESHVLGSGAVVVLEMEKDHDPSLGREFSVLFDKTYGDTRVMITQIHHTE